MIKYLTPVILCTPMILCTPATAVELDVGIGYTLSHDWHDGIWMDDLYKHKIHQQSGSYYVGLRFNPRPNVYLTAGYQHLGTFSSDALATASDANYAAVRAGTEEPWPLSRWRGKGKVDGLKFMGEYHKDNWFISAGVFAHESNWKMIIDEFRSSRDGESYQLTVRADTEVEYGRVFGFGYKKDNWSVSYEITEVKSRAQFYAGYRGDAQGLNFRYTFGGNKGNR